MPDILTHSIFGEDVLKILKSSRWKDSIKDNMKLYTLGCQGPDIFLYNDFWPYIKNKRGPKIGRRMHREKTGEFFIEGLKYIKNNINDKDKKKKLVIYLLGFMCHFALDRNAHPYIFYYSGVYNKEKKETHKYKGHHKRLELAIDTALIMEKKGTVSYKHPVYKMIDLGSYLPEEIVSYYDHILKALYDIDNKGIANDAYRDFVKAFKILYDPHGFKKKVLKGFDALTNNKNGFAINTYPRRLDHDKYDYLNKKKDTWNHPCCEDEVYNLSFYEIYDKGVLEAKEMIEASIDYIEGVKTIDEIVKFFPNISYATGKDTKDKSKITYFKSIFV